MNDKQLREAILEILREGKKPGYADWRPSQLETRRQAQTDQLLALFHTYGNRERIDEIVTLTPTLVMETECKECVKNEDTINNRIEELNREVES